jgi:glycosyltransferase involved in cell wall biosynthesis
MFDRVWTPSSIGADLMQVPGVITQVMPHCFDERSLEERRRPRNPTYDDGKFKFYYVGAWTCRKNPDGVIRAFTRAFMRTDPVTLIVRSLYASEEAFAIAWHRTGLAKTSPHIIFSSKPATDAAIIALHRDADCFVTATRGEGWNLPAFEAVLAGRHVISPANLGSDEFLADTSAFRYRGYPAPAGVDVTVKDAGENAIQLEVVGAQGQTALTNWREPDLLHLAAAMRETYDKRTRDLTINYNLADRFGYATVGKLCATYLEAL